MKTLDAVTLMKLIKNPPERDEEWLKEHADEVDDLIYDEWVGRQESWVQGSMLGSPNALKGTNNERF